MQPEPQVSVLLVDDHIENLITLEAVLNGLGHNLVKARSGEEALKRLLNQDFAVILLDVQMPGIDGFETATLIRQRERSRDTPIIFLTAFGTSDSWVFKGYSLKAVDYLIKPIEPEILTSKVSVFIELYQKNLALKQQTAQLVAINAELRQSEERFRSLSACSPVGIFLADINGSCTYTNPRCQAICGFTLEESLGSGWTTFIHACDRERVVADWLSHISYGNEYSDEFRFQTPNGTVRWTHVRSSPMILDQGRMIGYVGTIEDITDRKQAEEARAQIIQEQAARQQAEEANRMKDEFLAVLSHELRTPLNSILGWAQLLETRTFDPNTTTRAIEVIRRNARLQADLIENILDVSRIIQGKLSLKFVPTILPPVILAAVDAVRPSATKKNIQLEATFAPHVGMVLADPDRLQQIIGNLLSNAIKFTSEGDKVEIKLEQVDADVQIQVIDTGIGISPSFLPHVFERFRQADSSITRTHGGLGLGLAIAKHLTELHGGTIAVESRGEGHGSTFIVKLPLISSIEAQSNGSEDDEQPIAPEVDLETKIEEVSATPSHT